MSNAGRVQEQVFAAVAKSGLAFREGDGFIQALAPPIDGENQSTAIRVWCDEHSNGNVVVYMVAPVLANLPKGDKEIELKAHLICNSLNQGQVFGRWVYYPEMGTIAIEHELVGEDLDPSEIIGTLVTVAHTADRWDDQIQANLEAGDRLYDPDVETEVTS